VDYLLSKEKSDGSALKQEKTKKKSKNPKPKLLQLFFPIYLKHHTFY